MTKSKKARLTIIAAILLVLLIAYTVFAVLPRENYVGENPMMKEGDLPLLIAHGGGNREFPDNTLEAFYNAYSVSKHVMMETDVSITKDGVLILSHDTTLDRKTNVSGNICDWNYSDLIKEKVDFGYTNKKVDGAYTGELTHFVGADGKEKYPTDVEYPDGVAPRDERVFLATTLEELLAAFPENRINVEIKQEGELGKSAFREALRLIEKYDAFDRVVLASFHGEIYDEFKRYQKEELVPKEFMYSPGTSGVIKYYVLKLIGLDYLFSDGIAVFQLPTDDYAVNLATKSIVNNIHEHNLAVHYWTINDEEEMRELIELGVDGIMTDYPHRLKSVYEEYQN